ncbi:MAG: glycosyltransferase family 2 protein [Actinomycetota bacterium]|nr:glycosyltransferase family 2 protein [Actinomycetota bacterium]
MEATLRATYVLPLRWTDTAGSDEMTRYLTWLGSRLEVIVVDGSPPEVFENHARAWSPIVKHLVPDADLSFLNGKVNGVTTGIGAAGYDRVIVADDDIRYDALSLDRMTALLKDHDLVIAQSYFDPSPWHARWDTARILLNRAFGVHFPATVGLRRSLFLDIGGYDGNVLFENLELMRSLRFAGAREAAPQDLFVRHVAAERGAFWSQRVRQAYDDFTLPVRMAVWLALGPVAVWSVARRRPRNLAVGAAAAVAVAEYGRRRAGGRAVYPPSAAVLAPLWLGERAVCSWAAVWYRVAKGGVPYRDGVIRRAATPPRELRERVARRLAHRPPAP